MINVLFLCIGNSCRSQMAEGFARAYGSDVMVPFSAGLSPAAIVQPLTKKVMFEKNISIDDQYPKDVAELMTQDFYMIVNITGNKLPIRACTELREWQVEDPIAQSEEVYVKVRDQIEGLVMQLILDLRRRELKANPRPAPKRPVAVKAEKPAEKQAEPAVAAKRIGFGRIRSPRD